jgi:3-isopropylmalate/(R)-2-methylmalate dehydratase small subunit
VTVDLEAQTITAAGFTERFDVDPFARECLLNGWDAVGLSLRHVDAIAAYEGRRASWLPRVT